MRRRVCELKCALVDDDVEITKNLAAAKSCASAGYGIRSRVARFVGLRTFASPLARHASAVEMLLDLRAVAGALEIGAE